MGSVGLSDNLVTLCFVPHTYHDDFNFILAKNEQNKALKNFLGVVELEIWRLF